MTILDYKKYINFSLILIVLSVFDIITTQYALKTYPYLSEGNPIMALVTGSFALFVLVKAIGILVIVNIYKRIRAQSELASKVGQTVIALMMLLVVGNNIIHIASAVSFGFPSPYELESPARINIDGSTDYAFMGHNNYNVTDYFGFNTSDASGLIYTASIRFYSNNTVRYAVVDWAHPQRLFLVFSNLDVAYTDSIGTKYEDGYYADNVWPIPGCSNCNDLHKIGVLTELNPVMGGFVNSDGDLILGESTRIIKFTRSADFTKTTLKNLTAGVDFSTNYGGATNYAGFINSGKIGTISIDSTGNYSVGINGYMYTSLCVTSCAFSAQLSYAKYDSSFNLLDMHYLYNVSSSSSPSGAKTVIAYGKIQIGTNGEVVYTSNTLDDNSAGVIRLRYMNASDAKIDICPTFCATISTTHGLQVYSGYAYIASAIENKIYRFPTTIQVSSGSGYVPGAGAESTDLPDITYTEKSINSLYANYYNTSKFSIQAKINFASGNWPTSVNYGINDQAYRWQIKLVDPNGVTVNSWDTGECDASGITHCELSILQEYTAPSTGWQAGNWYVKLYEHKIDDTLFGDAAKGNLALLTTSATWNVLNASTNATGAISPPIESIDSPGNLATISLFDGYVGLMGFGINGVSKFLFALAITVIMFVVGMYLGKSGDIGLALSSLPFTFFIYISYVPKWVFVVYIIMLIMLSRVFR